MATPFFGSKREYVWVRRQGFFVRRPVSADGVAISEVERRKAEDAWLTREHFRETRRTAGHYAFVGPERLLDRDVLRIEYYPEKLVLLSRFRLISEFAETSSTSKVRRTLAHVPLRSASSAFVTDACERPSRAPAAGRGCWCPERFL